MLKAMSQRVWLIVIAIIVLATLGFAYNAMRGGFSASPTPSPIATEVATPTPEPTPDEGLTVELESIKESTQSGTAMIKEVDGKVMVTLELTGGNYKTAQPVHIHAGKCPGVGAVKYPLKNVVDGKSETTLDINLEKLLSELPLAINVHESAAKINVYTACGSIEE